MVRGELCPLAHLGFKQEEQRVCHTLALPFTLKKYLKKAKEEEL
jgi:hypothetical protein